MLKWLEDMTPAELSKQAADYATLARTAALQGTREAFDRLAVRCAALAAERADAEARWFRDAIHHAPPQAVLETRKWNVAREGE